jgi:hypothetical protein
MERTPFELTPEQKGMLDLLSRETGKPIPTLLAEALEELQERVHRSRDHDEDTETHQQATCTPTVLDIFQEAREGIPEETWKALPQDLAAQHDHYIYGTPKHPE